MNFKVYYSDGSTFSVPDDGTVGETPIYEVLLIVEYDKDHGRKIISGGDYYIYDDGKWLSVDSETRNMYMARPGMKKRYLIGVMVHSNKWNTIVKLARNDSDFPTQTALHGYETKDGF